MLFAYTPRAIDICENRGKRDARVLGSTALAQKSGGFEIQLKKLLVVNEITGKIRNQKINHTSTALHWSWLLNGEVLSALDFLFVFDWSLRFGEGWTRVFEVWCEKTFSVRESETARRVQKG